MAGEECSRRHAAERRFPRREECNRRHAPERCFPLSPFLAHAVLRACSLALVLTFLLSPRLTSNPATFLSVVKVLVAGLCARFKEKARTLTSCYCSQKLPNWSQVLNVYAEHAVCPDAYEFVLDLMPQVDDEWARLWTSVWAGRLALRHADQHIRDKGAASFTAAYANLKSMPASDAASEDKDKCLGVLRESFCYCRMTVETVMCGDDGSSLAPFCWRRAGFDNLVADAPSSNDVNALIVEILSRESATEVLAGVKSLEARAEALPTAPEHAFERIVTYVLPHSLHLSLYLY